MILKALLEGGADPRIRDNAGQFPIYALRSSITRLLETGEADHLDILRRVCISVKFLMKNGAKINDVDLAWIEDWLQELEALNPKNLIWRDRIKDILRLVENGFGSAP